MKLEEFYTVVAEKMFTYGTLLVLVLFSLAIAILLKPYHKENPKNEVFGCGTVGIGYIPTGNDELAKGKVLFKANCASCHKVDKQSTGPMLRGARQRWIDAGEGELIYSFIWNSQALIESDSSTRAKQIFQENKESPMNSFVNLSKEDIDNILAYADWY